MADRAQRGAWGDREKRGRPEPWFLSCLTDDTGEGPAPLLWAPQSCNHRVIPQHRLLLLASLHIPLNLPPANVPSPCLPQLDWRPLLPHLTLPCLNVVGGDSGVFPPEGCLAVGHMAPDCCNVTFKRCNHCLYLEQPQVWAGGRVAGWMSRYVQCKPFGRGALFATRLTSP